MLENEYETVVCKIKSYFVETDVYLIIISLTLSPREYVFQYELSWSLGHKYIYKPTVLVKKTLFRKISYRNIR